MARAPFLDRPGEDTLFPFATLGRHRCEASKESARLEFDEVASDLERRSAVGVVPDATRRSTGAGSLLGRSPGGAGGPFPSSSGIAPARYASVWSVILVQRRDRFEIFGSFLSCCIPSSQTWLNARFRDVRLVRFEIWERPSLV